MVLSKYLENVPFHNFFYGWHYAIYAVILRCDVYYLFYT